MIEGVGKRECWKHKAENGYRSFSQFTSFHGFSELYHAKSFFAKLFWIVCLCAAFGITFYQVHNALIEYIEQSSTTIIQLAKKDETIYPPIKLCYTHFVYWVDFEKGYDMQFSKEAILFGLSYMDTIYTMEPFNITEAKNNFTKTLKLNNMTLVSQFYKAIAKYAPLRYFEDEQYKNKSYPKNGGPYFKTKDIMTYTMYKRSIVLFCYVEDGYDTMKYIELHRKSKEIKSNRNILKFAPLDAKYAGISSGFSQAEYNIYMATFIENDTPQYQTLDKVYDSHMKFNYTSFYAPMIIFADGYSDIGTLLTTETDEYIFTFKISAHRWKNTEENPCNISLRSVISDVSCYYKACAENFYYGSQNKSTFYKLHYIERDTPQNLYNCDVVSFYEEKYSNTSITSTTMTSSTAPESPTATNRSGLVIFTVPETHTTACADVCLIGCEVWNFELSISSSTIYSSTAQLTYKLQTNIKIIYPADGDILMMTEVDSQTWETFIGNIGGILGIWTGASIMSFIQLFYLFCCTDCDCCESGLKWKCGRTRDAVIVEKKTVPRNLDSVV